MTQKDLNYKADGKPCGCPTDHNSVYDVVQATFVVAERIPGGVTRDVFARTVESVLTAVGYVRAADELEALRSFVADLDSVADLPTADPRESYDFTKLNDISHNQEED